MKSRKKKEVQVYADLMLSSLSHLAEVSKNSLRALARGEFLFSKARPDSDLADISSI